MPLSNRHVALHKQFLAPGLAQYEQHRRSWCIDLHLK